MPVWAEIFATYRILQSHAFCNHHLASCTIHASSQTPIKSGTHPERYQKYYNLIPGDILRFEAAEMKKVGQICEAPTLINLH